MAEGRTKQLEAIGFTQALTIEAIRRQVAGDIRALFTPEGNLRRIVDLTAEEASMIAGVEVVIKNAAAGDGHTDTVHKIKLKDASRYVEMAAKHFGLLAEHVVHSGGVDIRWRETEA